VPASAISHIEIYRAGDLRDKADKAEPVKLLRRSSEPGDKPVEVYAAVVFDESEE
jgi:hypothetical protein